MEKLRARTSGGLPEVKGQIAGYRGAASWRPPGRPSGSQALYTDHSQDPLRLREYLPGCGQRDGQPTGRTGRAPALRRLKSQEDHRPSQGSVLNLVPRGRSRHST